MLVDLEMMTGFAVLNDYTAAFATKNPNQRHGHIIWITDGTPDGTISVDRVGNREYWQHFYVEQLVAFQDAFYVTVWYALFSADEMWKVTMDLPPTPVPTMAPTIGPPPMSSAPSESPTLSSQPTPTFAPTSAPTLAPTSVPTQAPTQAPTSKPSFDPNAEDVPTFTFTAASILLP